jgi:two-component sensor histidine kinase
MDRWASLLERIRPYSPAALIVALACIALATAMRMAFAWMGAKVLFTSFFPAVLLASLLAGVPAGILVIAGAILVVWWTFIPPLYQFGPLGADDVLNFAFFAISAGCIVALSQLYRDVLRRVRTRDRERDLLLQELEHRGRNTYAVVESIVRNTLADDPERANAIAGRVRAVSSANDLVNRSGTKTVTLKALLALEFAPNADARLRTTGPNIGVSPDAARKLGLVFHELVTNAMKHGALSVPNGRVVVQWRADDGMVQLDWKEENGPRVSPPRQQGFGTVIVTQSLKSLGGDISIAFDADGLRCDMTFACR